MSSLNKLELNTLIVSMRHNVSRAKVHSICKLTREIKKLRSKKANEQLKLKNEKKAVKLVNEVLIMKKIPHDEVAAFSLHNSRKAGDILKDIESSFRLKALARLSCHKNISSIVQHFRIKYPSWEKEFPKVLIALKKHEKLKSNDKKKESLSKVKKQDNFSDNSAESDIQKVDGILDSFSSEDDSPKPEMQKIPSAGSNKKVQKEDSFVFTKGNQFSVSFDDSSLSSSSKCQSLLKEKTPKNNKSSKNSLNFDKETSKSIKTKSEKSDNKSFKETPLNDEIFSNYDQNNLALENSYTRENVEAFNIPTQNSTSPDCSKDFKHTEMKATSSDNTKMFNISNRKSKSPTPQLKKKIDNFFLVDDNKPYEALDQINIDTEVDSQNNENDINYDSAKDSNKYGVNSAKKQFNNNRHFNQNSYKNKNDHYKSNDRKNKLAVPKKTKIGGKMLSEKTDVKLHPSWQAKKKLSTMAHFQGKKIVFE